MNKLLMSACFVGFAFFSKVAPAAEQLDQTIAVVEQDIILESELKRRMKAIVRQLQQNNQSAPPMEILQQQVLERMIVDSLQMQMAMRAGVRIAEQELNAAVGDIAKQNQMSLEQLRQSMEKDGINWELFREDLRAEIMVARVRRGQVGRRIKISDREIENLVALMEEQGEQNIQYHLGHILIPVQDSSDQLSIQTAREKAQDLVKQLREGAEFSSIAIAHSSGQEALQGGDFGWRPAAQLPTLFSGPAKQLEVGEVSDPLRSGSGFHIIKLIEKKGEQKHVVQQVRSRHILLMPNTIRDDNASEKLIRELKQRIDSGANFDELAKEYSDDKGSALSGGVLDWTTPDTFVGPFKEVVETLPLNKLSDPVLTQFGWHIIEVLGRRDADQTDELKRNRAAQILQARKFDEEVESWLQELRDTSYVEILISDDKS